MSYLERLRAVEHEKTGAQPLTKLTEAPLSVLSVPWVPLFSGEMIATLTCLRRVQTNIPVSAYAPSAVSRRASATGCACCMARKGDGSAPPIGPKPGGPERWPSTN